MSCVALLGHGLVAAFQAGGPSSWPIDDPGRARRVKAKPADADCFASLDTTTTA